MKWAFKKMGKEEEFFVFFKSTPTFASINATILSNKKNSKKEEERKEIKKRKNSENNIKSRGECRHNHWQ